MLEYVDVTSSNISRIGYDPDTYTASAAFKDKSGNPTSTWLYHGVSQAIFDGWKEAESPGRYFRDRILNKFSSEKLVEEG